MKSQKQKPTKIEENLVGRWAVCGIGRIGKITGKKELEWGESWVGIGIDGLPWASRVPRVICEKDADEVLE